MVFTEISIMSPKIISIKNLDSLGGHLGLQTESFIMRSLG